MMWQCLVKSIIQSAVVIAAIAAVAFTSSCSRLVSSSGFNQSSYTFPGVSAVISNGDGTYLVQWENVPKESVSYKLFVKEGTAADPTASKVEFDFLASGTPLTQNRYVTPNVSLKYNQCFVVRFVYTDYTNTNTLCTNHARTEFVGISSAAASSLGVALTWPLVPTTGIQYFVYSSAISGVYDYSMPSKVLLDDNAYLAPAVALGAKRCFLVRYYKQAEESDTNSKEICVGESGLSNFSGISSATSSLTGSAVVTWNSAGSLADSYRIYSGPGLNTLLWTASGSSTSATITGLTPEQTYTLGVRAADPTGREDTNTKTESVTIANLAAPSFLGTSSLVSTGARSFTIKWTPATPAPASYKIFISPRDATHSAASTDCDNSAQAAKCAALMTWSMPYITVSGSATEYTLTNMGDDQSIFVAVRAVSIAGVSDTNTTVKRKQCICA